MRNLIRSEYFSISTLIIIALAIGIMTFRDYGESFDEGEIYWYGEYSTYSYLKILKGYAVQDFELPNLNNYGPSYFMTAFLLSGVEQAIIPGLTLAQAWHFFNFVTFLFGSFAIYILARRWLSLSAAFGTALLYTTQPLLWGHAFINPKDIPFATFFLASIVSGLWMCDKIFLPKRTSRVIPSFLNFINHRIQIWNNFVRSKTARNIAVFWACSIIFLWLFGGILDQVITILITRIYSVTPNSFWGFVFAQVAPNASSIPVSSYIHKTKLLFFDTKIIFTLLGIFLITWGIYQAFPHRLGFFKIFQNFLIWLCSFLTKSPIVLAGIILGLTTSIRILGPLAGVIVTAYTISKYGRKAIVPLLAYAITAILIMYLTWPFLWNAPLTRFFETFTRMSSYPWAGQVLFAGTYYPINNLPWSYLPVLISIQLTEPVIFLFWIGCALTTWNLKHRVNPDFLMIIILWFFIPFLGIIVTKRPLYDNFRQLLFLMPPIFMLCGVALEFIFQYFKRTAWKAIFLLVIVLPGIYSGYSLHPYQYIYYNTAVGGVGGAYQRFETDYWFLSFKEASDYLNASAPIGATIIAPLGHHLVHTRSDLIVKPSINFAIEKYDYVMLNSRSNGLDSFPDDHTVLTIERNGAILAEVRQASKYYPGK